MRNTPGRAVQQIQPIIMAGVNTNSIAMKYRR